MVIVYWWGLSGLAGRGDVANGETPNGESLRGGWKEQTAERGWDNFRARTGPGAEREAIVTDVHKCRVRGLRVGRERTAISKRVNDCARRLRRLHPKHLSMPTRIREGGSTSWEKGVVLGLGGLGGGERAEKRGTVMENLERISPCLAERLQPSWGERTIR